MKRLLLVVFCSVCCGSFAQGSEGESENGARRVRKGASAKKSSAAKNGEAVLPDASASVGAGQDDFDQIMGSFSELAMKFSEVDSSDLELFVYECNHITGEAFVQSVEPFLSVNGEIADCEDSDLVIISDEKERIEQLKKIAESIDRPVRQVLVSASVVAFQITDSFEKDISLQYNQFRNLSDLAGGGTEDLGGRILDAVLPSGGNPTSLNGKSSYVYYNPDDQAIFSAFMTFLDGDGTAQILSSPSLIMRRGHTGNILSGEDIPITKSTQNSAGTNYSIDYKSVGIKLRVTPESIFDDRVVLEVSPEVSNIIRYEESAAGRNPVVAIRSASTMLEMNDGYMVSIGGLLREEQLEVNRKVPILGDLPLIGALFRATSFESVRSQLVIFLSVNVLDPDELSMDTVQPAEASEEVGARLESYREDFPSEESSIWSGFKGLFDWK